MCVSPTARAPDLQAAAPEVWVALAAPDARELGVSEGDEVEEVSTARGSLRGPARIVAQRRDTVFVPFHYGYGAGRSGRQGRGSLPVRDALPSRGPSRHA